MSEFKISRLRFSWAGEWESDIEYNRDEIVQYQGKAYVCLDPHTSTEFYTDLENIIPRWDLMMTGQTWRGSWTPSTLYSLDNIVIFGGIVYQCNQQHISQNVLDDDIEYWDIYTESKSWENEWQTSNTYGIGAIVNYGGVVYECIESHQSASTINEGLESDLEKWQILSYGVQFKGEYSRLQPDSSIARYKLNDIVRYDSSLYICTDGHVAPEELDGTKWDLWLPGLRFEGEWDDAVQYQFGDIVRYGGNVYRNKQLQNTNIVPSTNSQDSTDAWELISKGYSLEEDWDDETEYKVGSIVRYGGSLWTAVVDNLNEIPTDFSVTATYNSTGSSGTTLKVSSTVDVITGMTITGQGFSRGQTVVRVVDSSTLIINEPPNKTISNGAVLTFSGINFSYWELLVPSIRWQDRWEETTRYISGDIAYWANATYRCIRDHDSALVNRPDNDLNSQYWTVYILHYQQNILNSPGELIVFNNGQPETIQIGADTNVLKVINVLPTWSEIFFTPAVYYVAENGIDSPDRGTTWDIPWRSVKYACEHVSNGVLNPNAKFLLESNKEFIVAEAYQWMLSTYVGQGLSEEKTIRDASYAVDAIIFDLIRGGNSQTVAFTESFFGLESTNKFATEGTAEKITFFIGTLTQLFSIIGYVLDNDPLPISYQSLNAVPDPIDQVIDLSKPVEPLAVTTVGALANIILTSLNEGSTKSIPQPNQGLTVTINIKSGTYEEELPISVPPNTALNGDELRGVVVRPKDPVNTLCTRTTGELNVFTVGSTVNMANNTPVQFVSLNPITDTSTVMGGVVGGQTYYVIGSSITPTTFQVSETPNGSPVTLFTSIGFMYVYGGTALSDMFRVRNGTGIRNMTLAGLLGTLTPENGFLTRRPTGGSYVALDPGEGPEDTSAWIIRKSPYIQNVTNFGTGCIGLKIDSTLHNGGNRSIVCNDFTQIISDGIGIWCTGGDALCEAVSVFSYYNYAGYFSENGGRIRATNGNSSYGTFGVVAEGFDQLEVPALGEVNNKSTQATASTVSALGPNAEILKIQYTHSGEEYFETTTNLLKSSNDILSTDWTTDSVIINRAPTSPFPNTSAWLVEGNTSLSDSSYLYQDVDVAPQGRVYSNVSGTNIAGAGVGATFDITVTSTGYIVAVNNGGSGYVVGNQIFISGKQFGGREGFNDVIITVQSLAITSILTVTHTGQVPEGSDLLYTLSVYAKRGTSASFDMYTIFSGVETKTSYVNYNFDNGTAVAGQGDDLGAIPDQISVDTLDDGWYRISYVVHDVTAQNTQLQFRLYPRGRNGVSGSTNFYGTQLQIGSTPTFYLETTDNTPTAYANYSILGAGQGVKVVGDELRSGSVFQTRVIASETEVRGGLGYKINSNNAQDGNLEYLVLAQPEVASAQEYEGMRLTVSSGKGAGQYGIISKYDPISKFAYVLKETFDSLEIVSTDSSTDRLEIGSSSDFNTVYIGQKIQFTPTFYDIVVESISQAQIEVTATTGNLNNIMTVTDTSKLRTNMQISFTGEVFGGVITNFTYYVLDIIDETNIQIATSLGGGVWPLVTEEGSMTLNYPSNTNNLVADTTANMEITYPIQFTGSSVGGVELGETYYIHEIYDSTTFSISASLVDIIVSGTDSVGNAITCDSTTGLTELYPIIFKGNGFGNIEEKTKYYINTIIDGTNFTLSSGLITATATATQAISNLITVDSTAGFIANAPITFTGTTFGGIVNDRVYYIQVVNTGTTFTISNTPGGAAVTLTSATGEVAVRTSGGAATQLTTAGSLQGVTTSTKLQWTSSSGSMNGTFFTELFGGVDLGTTYYVLEKFTGSANEITITDTEGGTTPFSLTTDTGSMQIGEVGWDNINPGVLPVSSFDSTSVYLIEPRIKFPDPPFDELTVGSPGVALSSNYRKLASGNGLILSIPESGDLVIGAINTDQWDISKTLPVSGDWANISYGNGTWIITPDTGTTALVSTSNGNTWLTSTMPASGSWSILEYGNGYFVSIAPSIFAANVAYSADRGATWNLGTGLPDGEWVSLAYGAETFVAIASGTNTMAYSTDNGATWNTSTLPDAEDSASPFWSSVAYGNGRFVAIANDARPAAYSFDGITWYSSNYDIDGDLITYGQGIFLVLKKGEFVANISTGGLFWKTKGVTQQTCDDCIFLFDPISNKGTFFTIGDGANSKRIYAGTRPLARAIVEDGSIANISFWESGSNYDTAPTLTLIDPNNSQDAILSVRVGNGSLSAPTFVSQGAGYNATSTVIEIQGSGFADRFQTGTRLICKNVTRLPSPGDNLELSGNSEIYRVASARILKGSTIPTLEVEIRLSPEITTADSPQHEATFSIRSRFSQVRLTNHDFLNIGYGNQFQSNYPNLPINTGLEPQDEVVETNNGRVFYSSTDQDGNFRVGDLFAVEQATGVVTLNASDFGLEGLTELTIGGVALGGSPVVINEFSTDGTFVANSNNIVPTQRAIRTYLASRLSQGGSNTFTGVLIAGTVRVGGPDEIGSTLPEGAEGWRVQMPAKVNVSGPTGAWAGDGLAMSYFMKTFVDPTREG
jgi:hypothetical protein